MSKDVAPGTENFIDRIFIRDIRNQTQVVGLTGLTYLTADLVWYMMRDDLSAPVQVSLAAMTLPTWVSGGFAEIDPVNMPGAYAVGAPNAEFAAGTKTASNQMRGAANMEEVVWSYDLVSSGGSLYGDGGAVPFAITLRDTDGLTPLDGVSVYVSADIGGLLRSQTKVTDALGRVVFNLDAGAIYVWPSRFDRAFAGAPYLETVS